MKKQYFVLDTINNESGLYYTVICPVSVESDNVITKLTRWAGNNEIKFSLVCSTKKKAHEICTVWRRSHEKAGNAEIIGF